MAGYKEVFVVNRKGPRNIIQLNPKFKYIERIYEMSS